MNFIKSFGSLLSNSASVLPQSFQQVRTKYVNRWMYRDAKRRKVVVEYAKTRLRMNCLRRNDILPPELRNIADEELRTLPKDSHLFRTTMRCVLTSRPRGTVYRWRLSRIMFRHLSDYNKLAGIERAIW